MLLTACRHTEPSDEPETPYVPGADWQASAPESPVGNMTCVFAVSGIAHAEGDILAVDLNGTCRAQAVRAELSDSLWYAVVQGGEREAGTLTFRFYRASEARAWTCAERADYEADAILGTVAEPFRLTLSAPLSNK